MKTERDVEDIGAKTLRLLTIHLSDSEERWSNQDKVNASLHDNLIAIREAQRITHRMLSELKALLERV